MATFPEHVAYQRAQSGRQRRGEGQGTIFAVVYRRIVPRLGHAQATAMPAWDYWTNRRVHPVAILIPLIILASFPIRQALAATAGWGHFAEWLIR